MQKLQTIPSLKRNTDITVCIQYKYQGSILKQNETTEEVIKNK